MNGTLDFHHKNQPAAAAAAAAGGGAEPCGDLEIQPNNHRMLYEADPQGDLTTAVKGKGFLKPNQNNCFAARECNRETNSSSQDRGEEKENSRLDRSSEQEEEASSSCGPGPASSSKEEKPSPAETINLLSKKLSEAEVRAKSLEEEVHQLTVENKEKQVMMEKKYDELAHQAAVVLTRLTKFEEEKKKTQTNERKLWKEKEVIRSKLDEQMTANEELQRENTSLKDLLAQKMDHLSARATVSRYVQVDADRSYQGAVRQFLQVEDVKTNKPRNETDADWEQEWQQDSERAHSAIMSWISGLWSTTDLDQFNVLEN